MRENENKLENKYTSQPNNQFIRLPNYRDVNPSQTNNSIIDCDKPYQRETRWNSIYLNSLADDVEIMSNETNTNKGNHYTYRPLNTETLLTTLISDSTDRLKLLGLSQESLAYLRENGVE